MKSIRRYIHTAVRIMFGHVWLCLLVAHPLLPQKSIPGVCQDSGHSAFISAFRIIRLSLLRIVMVCPDMVNLQQSVAIARLPSRTPRR
ncbi:uncharacterized protein B0T23DRAFT_137628 [Neurospora hispaniola]|uniref:Secreted protein n=1 Tax=Neurospora hispaniola TaxID=588809 RepID=A0AAJ0I791_9PEZI|nr:hypothetical protein B0T23DRAFT_137628 [Neurospora hispaniola]